MFLDKASSCFFISSLTFKAPQGKVMSSTLDRVYFRPRVIKWFLGSFIAYVKGYYQGFEGIGVDLPVWKVFCYYLEVSGEFITDGC